MKHFSSLILGMSMIAANVFGQTPETGDGSFTLRVLHNNDGESSLLNVDHFASVLADERAAADSEGIPSQASSSTTANNQACFTTHLRSIV